MLNLSEEGSKVFLGSEQYKEIESSIEPCPKEEKLNDQENNNLNLHQEVINNRHNIQTIQNNISKMKQEISLFKENFAEIKHGLSYIYGKNIMAKGFVSNVIKEK